MTTNRLTRAAITFTVADGLNLLILGNPDTVELAVQEARKNGTLAESVEVLEPTEKNSFYSAAKAMRSVTLIGLPSGGWKVYGPFADEATADDFGRSSSEDSDYVVLSLKR